MLNAVKSGGLVIVRGLSAEGKKLAEKSLYGIIKVAQSDGLFTIKALGIKDAFKSKVKVRLV